MGAAHNNYFLYVTNEDDLIGLVAYSLYKQHKIGFLEAELARTGERATQEKIDTFCVMYGAQRQVELLRNKAQELLEDMNRALLEEAVDHIDQNYQQQLVSELKEGPGWIKVALQGVAGNVVTAGIVAFVLFGASSSKIGIFPTLADWAGYNITEKAPEQTPKQP